MAEERDRARVRSGVRRTLRLLLEEAQRQGCLEEVRRFPEVFVAFVVLLDPMIGGAVEQEMVTLQDIGMWLGVLLDDGGQHGMALV